MPSIQPCTLRDFAMYDYECHAVNPDAHQRAAFSVQSMVVSSGMPYVVEENRHEDPWLDVTL
jgi:hypothetical protein